MERGRDGLADGEELGDIEGLALGDRDGLVLGLALGLFEGLALGLADGDTLGDEFKGYVFRIAGGNDKQGQLTRRTEKIK